MPHRYAFGDAYRNPFESIVLEVDRLALEQAHRPRAQVKAYNPKRTFRTFLAARDTSDRLTEVDTLSPRATP